MIKYPFAIAAISIMVFSSCSNSKKEILPNPNKLYSDQCYVWLKEMPDFFRERNYLEGGLAWDRHSYQGIYVSDNPESLFYSRHYVGQTVVLFRPDEPGGEMNRANIIYQYSLSQGNDGDLDQIWLKGEFMPPEDCKQWVVGATGKHRGVKAEGVWHWHWPENRNWEKPENPPGYDYPNAEEFSYEYPANTEGQPNMLGKEYWIDSPPYGVADTTMTLGLPATEKPENTSRILEKGYVLIKILPDLQQTQLIPPGNKKGPSELTTGFKHYNFEGVYISENPESPFHKLPLSGKSMAIYQPSPGEHMKAGNLHCHYLMIQSGDPKGDQIWWWGESFPPLESRLTLKVATGKFEGLSGKGSWYAEWPADRLKPDLAEGYDAVIALDYVFDLPQAN